MLYVGKQGKDGQHKTKRNVTKHKRQSEETEPDKYDTTVRTLTAMTT